MTQTNTALADIRQMVCGLWQDAVVCYQIKPGSELEKNTGKILNAIDDYRTALSQPAPIDVDDLANFIRKVDGNNDVGAGALAEQIVAYLNAQGRTQSAILERCKAARKRLGDAKAIHSAWYVMPKYQADVYAAEQMNNIEQIIYSAICYLDGIDGPYLRELSAAPPVTGGAWLPIESAPKDEATSYLVWVPKRKGIDEYDSIIQVSNFQGDMYPDNKQCCVDWGDRIEGATHWQPLPAPPSSAEKEGK